MNTLKARAIITLTRLIANHYSYDPDVCYLRCEDITLYDMNMNVIYVFPNVETAQQELDKMLSIAQNRFETKIDEKVDRWFKKNWPEEGLTNFG